MPYGASSTAESWQERNSFREAEMESSLLTTRPVKRFRLSPGGAVLVSLLLHALLLAWIQLGGAASLLLLPVRDAVLASASQTGKPRADSLQFTFVDVPNDQAVSESPRARLLSDKTRVARQPVPTPPDATQLGPDP